MLQIIFTAYAMSIVLNSLQVFIYHEQMTYQLFICCPF